MAKKADTVPVGALLDLAKKELRPELEAARVNANKEFQLLNALESVALGLYDEVDKLVKKSPVDAITSLVLEQVNDVIAEAKALSKHDTHMQKLKPFVAAGDNPEQRDVLVILRLVKQGLERVRVAKSERSAHLATLDSDLRSLTYLFGLWIDDGRINRQVKDTLEAVHLELSKYWRYGVGYGWTLDMDKVNQETLKTYFNISDL